MSPRPGPLNLITDVAGLALGNASDARVRTGVSVLLCPGGWTAAVDVRGGGPATRETEVLGLENLVGKVDAIVLSGGSVFGLGAADAVTAWLSSKGVGLRFSPASPAIPIVCAASLHDLGNGGDKAFGLEPPYRTLGIEAAAAAQTLFTLGPVGAGLGAQAGSTRGGLGSASLDLGDGTVVGALAAVNPVGSVFCDDGQTFLAWPYEQGDEFGGRIPPGARLAPDPLPPHSRLNPSAQPAPGGATTLCVVAVNLDLSRAECRRVAMMAQDGLARAVRPAHTPFDGDLVFCIARGADIGQGADRNRRVIEVGAACADTLARAIARGVYETLLQA